MKLVMGGQPDCNVGVSCLVQVSIATMGVRQLAITTTVGASWGKVIEGAGWAG